MTLGNAEHAEKISAGNRIKAEITKKYLNSALCVLKVKKDI
jgi:hypothetical protein